MLTAELMKIAEDAGKRCFRIRKTKEVSHRLDLRMPDKTEFSEYAIQYRPGFPWGEDNWRAIDYAPTKSIAEARLEKARRGFMHNLFDAAELQHV